MVKAASLFSTIHKIKICAPCLFLQSNANTEPYLKKVCFTYLYSQRYFESLLLLSPLNHAVTSNNDNIVFNLIKTKHDSILPPADIDCDVGVYCADNGICTTTSMGNRCQCIPGYEQTWIDCEGKR